MKIDQIWAIQKCICGIIEKREWNLISEDKIPEKVLHY